MGEESWIFQRERERDGNNCLLPLLYPKFCSTPPPPTDFSIIQNPRAMTPQTAPSVVYTVHHYRFFLLFTLKATQWYFDENDKVIFTSKTLWIIKIEFSDKKKRNAFLYFVELILTLNCINTLFSVPHSRTHWISPSAFITQPQQQQQNRFDGARGC